MAKKQKKKRNKAYRGADAAMTRPVVTRVTAVNRSRAGQWFFERKKLLKPIITIVVMAIVILLIIVGIISIFTH